jgi:hypothetical protein
MLRNALSCDGHRIIKTIKNLYWKKLEKEIRFRMCSYLFARMQNVTEYKCIEWKLTHKNCSQKKIGVYYALIWPLIAGFHLIFCFLSLICVKINVKFNTSCLLL